MWRRRSRLCIRVLIRMVLICHRRFWGRFLGVLEEWDHGRRWRQLPCGVVSRTGVMTEAVNEWDTVRRRRTGRDCDTTRIYLGRGIFDCNNSAIGSLDESSTRMDAHVLGQFAVIGVYGTRMFWRSRRLRVENRVRVRRQFLCLSSRRRRNGGKSFIQYAGWLNGVQTHKGTIATSIEQGKEDVRSLEVHATNVLLRQEEFEVQPVIVLREWHSRDDRMVHNGGGQSCPRM